MRVKGASHNTFIEIRSAIKKSKTFFFLTRLYELVLNKPATRVCYHCATSSLTLFSTHNVADKTDITISYFTKSIFDNYDLFDIEN